MAVSVTCVKDFTIPEAEAGINWSTLNWTVVDFFESPPDSNSSGSCSGDTITCACDGTPSVASGGLNASGELTYTGPSVNCKVTISGIPIPSPELMSFGLQINHTTAGLLLQVNYSDLTTDPQVFPFTVPLSAADVITISGDGFTLLYTQNVPGAVNAVIVIANV